MKAPCRHEGLMRWVEEVAAMCRPDRISWADGSRDEYDRLMTIVITSYSIHYTKLYER